MGIFDALSTLTSGLSSQSAALQNISNNIANSQTPAFSQTNTQFMDTMNALQSSATVAPISNPTNDVHGAIQTSTVDTYMAISGDGYFTVEAPTGFNNGQPVFDGTKLYTRRGDFQPDGNGNLVNGAGYYLVGAPPIDPATGTVDVAAIPLVHIEGEQYLQPVGGEAFATTPLSGPAVTGATGTVVGNALEASNTDVTSQITAMVQTQQAYDLDSQALTTNDQMIQTLTNMVV